MAKAAPNEGRASESRVVSIAETDVHSDPVTMEIESDRPVKFLKDPSLPVPHDMVPPRIRDAIVADMGEEFFLSREWTMATLKKLHQSLTHPRENITNTLAIVCNASCPFKDTCPYDIMGQAPMGERCPREKRLAHDIYNGYIESVSTRLNIDENDLRKDLVYHNLINALVEVDLVRARLQSYIATEGEVVEVVTTTNQQTGEAYSSITESPYVRMLDRYDQKRDKLLRQLLATPEMAEKYRRKNSTDMHSRQIALLDRMQKMLDGADAAVQPRQIPGAIVELVDEQEPHE